MQKCVVRNRGKGTLKVRGNEVTLNSAKLHHEKCEKRVYYKAVHQWGTCIKYNFGTICTWLLEKQLERFSVQVSQSKCCICIVL